jgi:tripartite-type tricarboxylate transporter receptor subunit TctC
MQAPTATEEIEMLARWAATAALIAYAGASAGAAAYPDRPVRLIVPAAPGGAIDVVGRIVGAKLADVLGQNVVIDNRAGANNIIGTELAAHAAPDGYTLLITAGAHTINPSVYRKLPYDALRDFTPVSHIANSGGLVVVTHPAFPARTLQQLIEQAKTSPAKIAYASGGFGNATHLAGELFNIMAGVELLHVPYKAAGPAVNDVLGGHIPLMFGPSPVVVPMVQAGRLRALAFTGTKRSPRLPDVPTVGEAGVNGYEMTGWYGLYGPRGMPKSIADTLSESVRRIVAMPDTLERFNALNLEAVGSTPQQFGAFLVKDLRKYAEIAQHAGIKPQ